MNPPGELCFSAGGSFNNPRWRFTRKCEHALGSRRHRRNVRLVVLNGSATEVETRTCSRASTSLIRRCSLLMKSGGPTLTAVKPAIDENGTPNKY